MSPPKPEVQLILDHWRDLTPHYFLLRFTASILKQHHNVLKEARQGGSLTDQSTNSATYSSIEWKSKMSSRWGGKHQLLPALPVPCWCVQSSQYD